MILDPFDAAQKFFVGLIHEGHVQGWCKLAASLIASSFISFFGTFGSVLISTQSFILAIGSASLTTAVCFLGLWIRSPLTKGIPILYPGKIEAERIKELTESGTVYNSNERK